MLINPVQFIFVIKCYTCIFELFCLQNSLIVGMQPQVSGKVGSLVGWLVFGWTMFGIPDDYRILPKGQLSGPEQKCR